MTVRDETCATAVLGQARFCVEHLVMPIPLAMKASLIRLLMVAGTVLGLSASVQATPITFNLGGSGGTGSIGNQRSFIDGGLTVYATAWTSTDDTNLVKGALGQYSPGLGVCDSVELTSGCGSPAHTVENAGNNDYVLFLFSSAVKITSVALTAYGDTDATYWLGNVAGAASQLNLLTGATFAGLGGLGFGAQQDDPGSTVSRTVALNSPSSWYNALLFGASSSGTNDAFKILSVTVDNASPISTVPEPTTVALLGTGVLALIVSRMMAKSRS